MKGRKNTRAQKYKSTSSFRTCALMACALILVGCAQQQYEAVEQICLSGTDTVEAMQVAEDVLAEMHFTIEKADTENGLLRTRPLPGAQFFEFWRSDNVGPFNSTEANIHSLRRTVEIDIGEQAEKVCIACNVQVQRLSIPEYEVTSSGRAYELFTNSRSLMQRLELRQEQKEGMTWVDLGRDPNLETEILKRISSTLDARRSSLDIENRESSIE